MPILAGLLVSLFSSLASLFALQLTKKTAFGLAAVTTLGTLYGALVVTMNAAVSPLLSALFSTSYGQFIGLAFPPMAGTCLGIIASVWSACTLYSWQKKALDMFVQA
jgi:uncharacterized protein (DUF697 family)